MFRPTFYYVYTDGTEVLSMCVENHTLVREYDRKSCMYETISVRLGMCAAVSTLSTPQI